MPRPLSATLSLTLDLHLTGSLECDMVDDYCIEGLSHEPFLGFERTPHGTSNPRYGPRVDLLDGVDTSSPDVIRLLDNILKCVEAEAIEALREDADD